LLLKIFFSSLLILLFISAVTEEKRTRKKKNPKAIPSECLHIRREGFRTQKVFFFFFSFLLCIFFLFLYVIFLLSDWILRIAVESVSSSSFFLRIPPHRSNLIRLLGCFRHCMHMGYVFLNPTIAEIKLTPFFPFSPAINFILIWVLIFFPILIDNHVLGWWPWKLFLYPSWFTRLSRKLMKKFWDRSWILMPAFLFW